MVDPPDDPEPREEPAAVVVDVLEPATSGGTDDAAVVPVFVEVAVEAVAGALALAADVVVVVEAVVE